MVYVWVCFHEQAALCLAEGMISSFEKGAQTQNRPQDFCPLVKLHPVLYEGAIENHRSFLGEEHFWLYSRLSLLGIQILSSSPINMITFHTSSFRETAINLIVLSCSFLSFFKDLFCYVYMSVSLCIEMWKYVHICVWVSTKALWEHKILLSWSCAFILFILLFSTVTSMILYKRKQFFNLSSIYISRHQLSSNYLSSFIYLKT